MSISRTFDIAQSGLATYQEALDVTSNNISNASNPDYSRQRAIITSAPTTQSANIVWGNGAQMQDIQRVRDTLTDTQIRDNNQNIVITMSVIQSLEISRRFFQNLPIPDYQILSRHFIISWQQLAVTPNSTSLRNNVIQTAQSLSNQFKI